ncbi:MAG: heparinase II/III family protein [Clostridia bacterium]|nr:heparinase II/III family protein [Clostridia bacterium]
MKHTNKILAVVLSFVMLSALGVIPADNSLAASEEWDALDYAAKANVESFTDSGITSCSDEEFFGKYNSETQSWVNKGYLNYDKYSGLSGVKESAKSGNYAEAKELLLEFHRELYSGFPEVFEDKAPTKHQLLSAYAVKNNFQLNTTMVSAVLGIPTVSAENSYVEIDFTERITRILNRPSAVYSVELFGLKKDGTSLEFESRNANKGNPPVAEITVNGVVHRFEATDDATISPDDNYATNYGTEATLCAEESVSSIGLARLTDSNTKRSLIKFDFSSLKPLGTPTKAVIRLFGRNKGSGSGEMLAIEYANNAWAEDEVTFYMGQSGAIMEHATFSNYGCDSFRFDGGVVPDRDGAHQVFAYRYPEELLRFTWATPLAQIYHYNQDERYALTFLNQWAGYLKQRGKNPRYDKFLDGHCRDQAVAKILFEMIDSEYMTPELWTATMKYYQMELRAQIDGGNDSGNWGTYQINGMRALLGYGQTLSIYDEVLSTLQEWIPAKLDEAFRPDGSGKEIAWGYSFSTFTQLIEGEEMLKQTNLSDTTFPEDVRKKAYKIIKYFASLLMPGGGNPQVGDEAGYNGINYNDVQRNNLLYSVCDVPFWKYLASDGKEGTAPHWTTIGFTGSENEDEFVSGVYTMRSGWSDDAVYLYTDVDGNTNPGHGHADDNQIIIKAYGQYLLTDQSFSSYATQRIPLDSTKYHNTVYIDSVDQNRTGVTEYEKENPVVKQKRFETNSLYDNTTLTTPQNGDHFGLHTRNILYLKPGFFVVNDYLEPTDSDNHSYEQNWHMLPSANPDIDKNYVGKSNFTDTANVYVAQANSTGMAASVKDGYFGQGTGSIYDSHYLSYEKQASGNVLYDTVIYPAKPGETAEVSSYQHPLSGVTDNGATAMHIDIVNEEKTVANADYYLVHDIAQKAEREFLHYKTDGRSAFVNKNENGEITEIVVQDARYLFDTESGKYLFKSTSETEEFGYRKDDNTLYIETSDESKLKDTTLYVENIHTVFNVKVNGEETAFKTFGDYIYFGNKPSATDESFVIADFTQKNTVEQWTAASVIASNYRGKYDTVFNTYSLNWAMGSVGENYLNSLPEKFANLDFSDYGSLHLDFHINRSEAMALKYPQVKNWFTVVLSTSENPGLYDKYKNNECLTYEIDLSEFPLNKPVSKDIALADFVTQFDGMKDGVQGEKDGKTNLNEIKSISIFGGPSGSGAINGTGNPLGTWAFKNSEENDERCCGFLLYDIMLDSGANIIEKQLSEIMSEHTLISENITLPSEFSSGSVKWSSSNEQIISSKGEVFTTGEDVRVLLTAEISANDGTTKTLVYPVTVKAGERIKEAVIADFSNPDTVTAWLTNTSVGDNKGTLGEKIGKNGTSAYNLSWFYGSSGETYLANSDAAGVDFSKYSELCMEIKVLPEAAINNYFTVILSTVDNPADTGTLYGDTARFCDNECLMYEVDLNSVPHNEWYTLRMPLKDFETVYDGMKNGVQGTKDGTTNLSEIRSVSIYSGAANGGRLNANNEKFHSFTTWAFKNTAQAPDAGSMYLQEILLAPMKLESTSIENGAKDILPSQNEISFAFNDNINSVPAGVTVLKNGNKQDNYQLKVNNNVLTVVFSPYLDLKSEYHIMISGDLTNRGGGKLSENILFGFSTSDKDCWTGDFGIYTKNGKFTDMTSSANVYAHAGYVNSSLEKDIILTIAGYNQEKLVDVKSVPVKITSQYNNVISTGEISYNPQTMDCIKAFLWDGKNFTPVDCEMLFKEN